MSRGGQVHVRGLHIDPESRLVRLDGTNILATAVEFDILFALATRLDRPVSRSWLVTHVLDPDREGTERTLDVHISRLRRKLGAAKLIQTVWGIGYKIASQE